MRIRKTEPDAQFVAREIVTVQAFVLAGDDARRGDDHRTTLDILVDLRRGSVLHVVRHVARSFVEENFAQRLNLTKNRRE